MDKHAGTLPRCEHFWLFDTFNIPFVSGDDTTSKWILSDGWAGSGSGGVPHVPIDQGRDRTS